MNLLKSGRDVDWFGCNGASIRAWLCKNSLANEVLMEG